MLRDIRRRIYRKIRFKNWYRKCFYYHRMRGKQDSVIKDFLGEAVLGDKKRMRALRRDMVRSLFKFGSYYNEYFLFGYEGREDEYRNSFITEGIRLSYYPRMNIAKNTETLENKYLCYKKFRDFYKRDILRIKKLREGEAVNAETLEELRRFMQTHDEFIVKPVYAAFGKGVHKDSLKNHPSVEAAYAEYAVSGAVIEELIIQAPEMAAIHPSSVNTLRIPTAVVNGGEVRLFHPTLRVGRGGSVVDNFSAGGISALIDPDTGKLCSDGADKKSRHYAEHPDTGVVFKGFQIPDWEQAVEIVREAALSVPGNHYCGWDLAYSSKGWCMVEANSTAQMGGMQIITGEGRKAELEALIELMH